ncbi:MAG: beta-ketoacyl synthase N-terminal-like domain-containing protein [Candidatus Eremiobacteraeota bacterium]|nr:beta-ketoacyl synthase N-terminal-like domain-containing protein [Candidatus Eremiobacteraeota bacterium]
MEFTTPIAIVGAGGLFPGAPSLESFWTLIREGKSASREVPPGRWILQPSEGYSPGAIRPDRTYSSKGCFLDDFSISEKLDFTGLAVDQGTLSRLDPLFHIALMAAVEAFRSASTGSVHRSRTGVIIGNIALPTETSSAISREILEPAIEELVTGARGRAPLTFTDPLNAWVNGLPAGFIAHALGLGGGSFTIDAACASSLYAVKLACDRLLSGKADMMLSGGICRPDCLYTAMGFSQLSALSPDGLCAPFDVKANGLVIGEGAGILVLKRLEDALAQGDDILAVIKGIGLSNDIEGSLLAPDSEGQLRSMEAAYRQARWLPSDVDLLECHATGTPVGDAVEYQSLRKLWERNGSSFREGQCVIGSVKSNVGHLLTGAGAAGLIKVLLALREKVLPPTANYTVSPPSFDLPGSPFRVLRKSEPWPERAGGAPRRAAVSAFGFGGINAHVLIEEWQGTGKKISAVKASSLKEGRPVAIVGIDARFGPYDTLEKFRHALFDSTAREEPGAKKGWYGVPSSSWFHSEMGESEPEGFGIDDIKVLPGQFRIPPVEISEMLPQQLLMLLVAAGALKDAATAPADHDTAGVFIGISFDFSTTTFSVRWDMANKAPLWLPPGVPGSEKDLQDFAGALRDTVGPPLNANRTMGALGSIVASRIAREFRFGGPSFTVSSEECSGLAALEVAITKLSSGEIDCALAGAVDFAGDIRALIARRRAGEKPWPLFGEGAAAVVLKRLEDAERDGDRIYAVIRATGLAGGGKPGCDGPGKDTVLRALRRACSEERHPPGSMDFAGIISAESGAAWAGELFSESRWNEPVAIGEVAEWTGDAGAATAFASVVKLCLMLSHHLIPPSQDVRALVEGAPEWPFCPPGKAQHWLRNRAEGPRKGSVTCSSVDGTCAHVILEEYEPQAGRALPAPPVTVQEALFALRAGTDHELLAELDRMESFLEGKGGQPLAWSSSQWLSRQMEEKGGSHRLAIIARDHDEAARLIGQARQAISRKPGVPLRMRPAGNEREGDALFYAPLSEKPRGKTAYVFPGSGNHYPGMGRELTAAWSFIAEKQDRENLSLRSQVMPHLFWSLESLDGISGNHRALMEGQVAMGTLMADLLGHLGIRPEAAIGYSLGEMAGLFALRAWRARDEMHRRMEESRLFTDELAGPCNAARAAWGLNASEEVRWAIGVIDAPAVVVKEALRGRSRVYLLIINTQSDCVIGGDEREVSILVRDLGCSYLPVSGVTTVHCEVVKPVADIYRDFHLFPVTAPDGISFYSTGWGKCYDMTMERAADAILAQALDTVDFPRVIEAAYHDGVRTFIEIGPGPSCTRMIGRILEGREHTALAACREGHSEVSSVLRLAARLFTEGLDINLEKLFSPLESLKVPESAPSAPRAIRLDTGGGPFKTPDLPRPLSEKSAPEPSRSTVKRDTPPNPEPDPVMSMFYAMEQAKLQAHESYLTFTRNLTDAMAQQMTLQMALLEECGGELAGLEDIHGLLDSPAPSKACPAGAALKVTELLPKAMPDTLKAVSPLPQVLPAAPAAPGKRPFMDRTACMEFAVGSIAKVLGPSYRQVDSHPTRVRLPDEPLMLVDRIIAVEGESQSLKSGRVITEHDILPGAWYLDGGRIPTCIAVEAGQADLFLSGYLGIDSITRGLAVYRLLDAVVTFHGPLPGPGEVIHYDISIDRFFTQGDTWLFRFRFDSTVGGRPLLTMREGCAGFFTREELEAGKGIVHTSLDTRPLEGAVPPGWSYPVPMGYEAYSDAQVEALRKGDLAGAFGPRFEGLPVKKPLTIPGGKLMRLVDRVQHLDPRGGRFSLGIIRAEADIHPDDWFLTCHFSDDNVMPGTLMYECCMHTFRIFLLRMGWIAEEGQAAWEPVPGVASGLKCRGQVIESTRKACYEVSIKEMGFRPEPYAIADALMYADGKPVVEISNMSMRLSGSSKEQITSLWEKRTRPATPPGSKKALYDNDRILAFAVGKPSEAFGEPYRIFDSERIIARLPGPPYKFLDRITSLEAEPWKMAPGGIIEAQYDVPPGEWYFSEERTRLMPFSVLLEVALQPCGWLAAYVGSALTSDIDLSFRNLGGEATAYKPVTERTGLLTTGVKLARVSTSGGMIIQHYEFEMKDREDIVYRGSTYFGFFSKEALRNQVGIRDAKKYEPGSTDLSGWAASPFPTMSPFPGPQLAMIDTVECLAPSGGPAGLGYIRGTLKVDPSAWFFNAHFYQDPVIPGSLGLESMIQLMKFMAHTRWGKEEKGGSAPFVPMVPGYRHSWLYRGQVIPPDRLVTVECWITSRDDLHRFITADGFLTVDGRLIYGMKDFTLAMENIGTCAT